MTAPAALSRTSTLSQGQALLSQLQRTQTELSRAQHQIGTGQAFQRPSGAPDKVSTVNFLQRRLAERDQQSANLTHASNVLDTADQSLGESAQLLRESKSIAQSQIGPGATAQTREADAAVIQTKLNSLVDQANQRFAQLSTFGGRNGAAVNEPLFESFLGGVRYRGGAENLRNQVGPSRTAAFTSNGVEGFNALSTRVQSDVDLNPSLAAQTRLSEIDGPTDGPVSRGSVELTVNGSDVRADLREADTLEDVVTRINQAIDSVAPGVGSLSLSGSGFSLSTSGGESITINDVGQGTTAQSLGIDLAATSGPATVSGPALNRQVTPTTSLADLGPSLDLSSGLRVTQAGRTQVIDFSGASTIEDLANSVEGANLGLRLEINDEGSGLNLVSEVSGVNLSVGENGGSTASDLGLRTLDTRTRLDDFQFGQGVETFDGGPDLSVSLHDGTSFDVDLSGASTVGEVIGRVRSAATSAGLGLGGDFDIALASVGNGLVVQDNTSGANDFEVNDSQRSHAASDLGLSLNARSANTLTSEDKAQVRIDNAFTHLIDLRDSLNEDDTTGITVAASGVEDDLDHVVSARGLIGARARAVQDQKARAEDQRVSEQTFLSGLKDADLTAVITRFTQLQYELQASLQVQAQRNQLSLLDFLR